MKLHRLTVSDIPRLVLIEESAHKVPWTEDVFQRCFELRYHIWGLEYAEHLVGFGIYSLQVGECHILNICIHSQHQGAGFGKHLFLHMLDDAQYQGAGIAFLEVRRSNERALALYQKTGFIQVGERKGYYPNGEKGREDALVFALDLGIR